MIRRFRQDMPSNFDGTVIDIETIGEFNKTYEGTNDSRRCQYLSQVILGLFGRKGVRIFCAEGENSIEGLNTLTKQILDKLERPFYGFNTNFESSVWFHQLDKKINFDYELQGFPKENKGNARKSLGISNYDDPFDDSGKLCMMAWHRGDFMQSIAHNRACLLKERDILLKRGSFTPFPLEFNK